MRITKRTIALVLVAVLMLALLPTTAFADPPQNDPTHLHKWKVISETRPTCTENGRKTWKCTACGKTYTETRKALGHDWDEGVVTTEPQFFTPGERTYTCKRDPSHTRTETVEASAEDIFAGLHGYSGSWMTVNIDPLIVTVQPTGGSITRYEDEAVRLTCAVIGGTAPYTYQWYSRRIVPLTKNGWNWPTVYGEQTEPEFDAQIGDRKYYCLITDAAGDTVKTEYAEVTYKISIIDQPDNVNLQCENPTLSCEAMDGSGSYTYRWYNSDLEFQGQGASLPVAEEGDYFCTVEDNVTGEMIDTELCTVYSVKPFGCFSQSPNTEVWDGEQWTVKVSFWRGVEPYEVWWTYNGDALDTYEGNKIDDLYQEYCAETYETGDYIAHAVDAMGATAERTVHRWEKKLTISEQPRGGTIPKDSYTRINVVVADGEAPYTYILYRNGEEYLTETDDSDSCPVGVWYPGEYYYHIEDSQGRSADSDVVYFEDAVFRVKKQTESAEITTPESTARLEVDIEGGAKPYTYEWTVGSAWSWFKTGGNESTLTAKKPGYYSCRIKDKDGNCIKSKTIKVSYTGKKPWILSVTPNRIIGAGETTKLTCTAISGTGDDSNLRYDWYSKKPDGGWMLFAANAQTTETAFAWQYRCKVTDTVSGEYSTSEITTVSEEIASVHCENITPDPDKGIFPDAQKMYNMQYSDYNFSFAGGTGPYTIKVYILCKINYTLETYPVLYRTYTANNTKELPVEIHVPNSHSYVSKVDGEDKLVWEDTMFYVVIIDANGQKFTSDKIVTWVQ